ncbi:YitT family protein [Clostridium oryzae]|uniref:DUF2179 domain-containing protein n=1 Tax=Clostridium oryzae TaxID=1450648 RepID=A0A1V4IZ97_9CLOT|nr:YitT family protein [Clostridium oryzae]OPJ65104.1 hypothetical protein CLORY_01040 [Clostridium oryzae]
MKKRISEYMMITLGVFLVAFSIEYFMAPNNIAAGGVTGIAIILNSIEPKLSIGLITLVLNILLFILAFVAIDGKFGAKTIYASLSLSGILWVMDAFAKPKAGITSDLMLAAIFGTLISAIGMAIVFNMNASTGGTDILAKMINKFFNVDIGKSLLIVDFLITIFSIAVFGVEAGLYALLTVIISGFIVDYAIDGFNVCKQVIIITQKEAEISEFIIKELDRSFTRLYGKGGYKSSEACIIYTILSRKEYIELRNYIKQVDKRAFVAVNDSHEVLGEGFKDLQEI